MKDMILVLSKTFLIAKITRLVKSKNITILAFIFFTIFHSPLMAQKKWFIGVEFIPGYGKYHFGQQKININLLSGISIKKEFIKDKLFLSTGIFYYRNHLYGGDSTCYICTEGVRKTEYRSRFMEIPLNVHYSIYSKNKLTLFLNIGISGSFSFDVYQTNFDGIGNSITFKTKGLSPHDAFISGGILLNYSLNKHSNIYLFPQIRAESFDKRNSYILFYNYSGIGIGVNIEI